MKEGLEIYLKDNLNAWEMNSSGTYHLRPKRGALLSAQQSLIEMFEEDL
jgi:polyphosphate kinase